MGKQSHITDSTEEGTSDSYCDKLVFYLNSGLRKLSLRPTHFTQECLIYSFYPLLTSPTLEQYKYVYFHRHKDIHKYEWNCI